MECDAVLRSLPVDEAVAILEPHVLNSKFPVWYEQEAVHQVLHLAGAMDVYRRIVFQSALRTIWRSMDRDRSAIDGSRRLEDRNKFPKQLDLGRQQLWVLLHDARLAIISRVQRLQMGNLAMRADAEQLQHIQGQIQAARQLGYAPLDVQLRYREREAWAAHSVSKDAIGDENETVETQEVTSHAWEAAVLDESRKVSAMLMWVTEAWEKRVSLSTNKSFSYDISPTSPEEQRPQLQTEAQDQAHVKAQAQAQLADLQGAIEAHFALLDHLKGLLSATFLSVADGLSARASAVDYKRSIDRVRDLSELMQGKILPLAAFASHCRATSNSINGGPAENDAGCDTDNGFDAGSGRGRGTAESQPGERQLLAQCKAVSASASASTSPHMSQPSTPQSAFPPAYAPRVVRALQALHYYRYKALEYEACLLELLPGPATWERRKGREDLLQNALLHLECISIATDRGADKGSVEGGPQGRRAYLASLSEERKSEAVVVLLALAESLCWLSPDMGGSLDEIVGRQQRQAVKAERLRSGAEHSLLAHRLLRDLWRDRTAPAEVRELISHADEVGRACKRV